MNGLQKTKDFACPLSELDQALGVAESHNDIKTDNLRTKISHKRKPFNVLVSFVRIRMNH